MPEFKTTSKVSDQFILDVMTTMVESGALMWAETVSSVDRDEDLNVTRIGLYHEHAYEDAVEFKTIDADSVIKSIQSILNGEHAITEYIVEYIRSGVRDDDAGDIDEEAADVIAQVACMGEVVFG